MRSVKEAIEQILQQELSPTQLEVIDVSHEHAGHAGNPGTGETHFTLRIKAKTLEELSPIEAHRRIYKLLAPYMQNPIHALKIDLHDFCG